MSQSILIQKEEEDEHAIKPYKFFHEYGDCADTPTAKNVSRDTYRDHFAFRTAGKIKVKHAP